MQTMGTLRGFVARHRVRIGCDYADRNPNMEDHAWPADHWKCTLRHGRRRMTLYFSKGVGHHGTEPDAEEVLDCCASDAAGVENASSFEDWCGDYGYDTDSRKAEKTYNACLKQTEALKRFLGDDLYRELLWDTDRL